MKKRMSGPHNPPVLLYYVVFRQTKQIKQTFSTSFKDKIEKETA